MKCSDFFHGLLWRQLFMFMVAIASLSPLLTTAAQNQNAGPQHDALFTQRLSGDDYHARLEKYWPEVNKLLTRPNHGPPAANGAIIIKVDPESQATKIGLTPGSVIVAVDDTEIFDRMGYAAVRSNGKACRITWLDPEGNRHAADVEPGTIGFRFSENRDLLAWFARSDLRDRAWERDMLLAIFLLENQNNAITMGDMDLAETALARAVEAGFNNADMLHSLAAQLSMNRLDMPAAWEHLSKVPFSLGASRHLMRPGERILIARANNQFNYIGELYDAHGLLDPHIKPQALSDWLDKSKKHAESDSPIEMAKTMRRRLITRDMQPDPDYSLKHNSFIQRRILAGEKTGLFVHAGHFDAATIWHPEGLQDFEIIARCGIFPNQPAHPKFPNALTFTVYDRDQMAREEKYWDYHHWFFGLHTKLSDDRVHNFLPASSPFPGDWRVPGFAIDATAKTIHEFRLIRVAGRAQVFFDGKCLLDTMVDPDQSNLMVMAHCVGLQLRDFTFEVYALEPTD